MAVVERAFCICLLYTFTCLEAKLGQGKWMQEMIYSYSIMSQLNFFFTDHELKERLQSFLSSGDYTIFSGRFFQTETPHQINNIEDLNCFDNLTIWVNNAFCKPICTHKGQGVYCNDFLFDNYRDPIIELDNCKFSDKLISPGRLFFKSGWIENKELVLLHKKMASKLVRVFKKHLVNFSSPFMVSSGITELMEKGFEVELGEGGKRINNNYKDG